MAFLLFVAALAGGCGGEQGSGSSEEAVDEQTAEQEAGAAGTESTQTEATGGEPAGDADAAVGDVVTLGDVQWTVTAAEQSDELLSINGDYEEGNFVIADVTFANGSNQDITLATPFLTVIDGEGNEFDADIESNFTFLYPEENFFIEPIGPGTVQEGKVIFSVAPGSSDFRLQVGEARFAAGDTAYIDLGV